MTSGPLLCITCKSTCAGSYSFCSLRPTYHLLDRCYLACFMIITCRACAIFNHALVLFSWSSFLYWLSRGTAITTDTYIHGNHTHPKLHHHHHHHHHCDIIIGSLQVDADLEVTGMGTPSQRTDGDNLKLALATDQVWPVCRASK